MTDLQPHPIRLEQLLFLRSCVVAIPEYVPVIDGDNASPQNNIQVTEIEGQPGRYSVAMKTLVNSAMEKSSPYSVDMECIGIFFADDTLSKEDALRGVTITGHSVLFGAIREAVAWITGRQPYGPLLLGLSVLRANANPTTGTSAEN